jgi:23S rRNA (adenine2030-N6)-methyltransferase
MNYRHAFHAGNFADCMKHALLLAALGLLTRKPSPVFVLDTHAGAGNYDLMNEAERTGEWREGFARLIPPTPALEFYVGLAERLGLYPGSPRLIRARLRPGDALACCELHPADHTDLRRLFHAEPQVAVHNRDGYEAIRALLPPVQRRALILIDPPYELPGEFDRVVQAFASAATRMDHAVAIAWYPIKHRTPVNEFHAALKATALTDLVVAELWLREPIDPTRLNGCGLVIRNPPWGFEDEAAQILAALRDALGGPGSGAALFRLTDE